jgi:hypothetical protein
VIFSRYVFGCFGIPHAEEHPKTQERTLRENDIEFFAYFFENTFDMFFFQNKSFFFFTPVAEKRLEVQKKIGQK